MAETEQQHAAQPFLQPTGADTTTTRTTTAADTMTPKFDHEIDPHHRPSVSHSVHYSPAYDVVSLPDDHAEDVNLYEFKGLAARKASRVRVLLRVFGKWTVTVLLIISVYAVLLAYSVDRPVISKTTKRQFNALITGLLIALGLATANFLTGMCSDMRWWILARRPRSQNKVENILHAHSMTRVIRMASSSRRSNIHVVVTLWVLLIIGAQIGIASIGLCYSVERTEAKALLVPGNVSIPNLSSIETTKVVKSSNSARAQEYTANSYGTVSLGYGSGTMDQRPAAGDLYYGDDPLMFCDDNTCEYVFHEDNTATADDPDVFAVTVVTDRAINTTTTCRGFRVTSGGNGTVANITIEDSGRSRQVTLPVLGGSDQSTFFTDTLDTCGPGCGAITVFEASTDHPWLYECNTTVGTMSNARLPEHAISDDFAWMVAQAIALQGYSTTAANEDLVVQGVVYPAESVWGLPMNGSVDALELSMSRFAIGVLAIAAQSNSDFVVWGQTPTVGQKLNMEHWEIIHLIMGLTAGLQLVLGVAAALIAHRVVIPEGGPVAEAEVLRAMLGGARKRRRGRFDKGKGSMSLAAGQSGGKTGWVYRNRFVGDGVYDLYMEEVPVAVTPKRSWTRGTGSTESSGRPDSQAPMTQA